MDYDWKKAGENCGRSLDNTALTALKKLDVVVTDNAIALKSKIWSVLRGLGIPYSNDRPLAWELAVVIKYGLPVYESIIICFGSTPFKHVCRLPNKNSMTADEVSLYYPMLRGINGDGDFVQVFATNTSSRHRFIYVYSFKETTSCSEIGSYHHDLPVPVMSTKPITYQELSTTITSGAGNAFIHMNAHATSTQYQPDGAMTIAFNHMVDTPHGDEEERTAKFIDHLKNILPSKYDGGVTVSEVFKKKKKKNCNFCYFTGGGDVKISKNQKNLLVMTKTEETESGSSSPIDANESRETLNVECKCSQTKSNSDVKLQLQANMLNLLVREFMENLRFKNATFESVLYLEKISMYGLSFGINRPVELLKITVDFKQTCLLYETKYANETSLPKEGLIDGIIGAVLDRISKRSPSPN